MFLGKGVLKICCKFTGGHPCRSVITTKLQSNIIEIAPLHGCSPPKSLHIFRIPFPKNTSERLLLPFIARKYLFLQLNQDESNIDYHNFVVVCSKWKSSCKEYVSAFSFISKRFYYFDIEITILLIVCHFLNSIINRITSKAISSAFEHLSH